MGRLRRRWQIGSFVAGYIHYDVASTPAPEHGNAFSSFCQFRGEDVMCGPRGLKGEPDHLFQQ